MTSAGFANDVKALQAALANLPARWDGKSSVLEMKAANYQWKQMEWWAFYFEMLCWRLRDSGFEMPGSAFGNVRFDATRNVNWDLKAKAIKSDNHSAILNDKEAMNASIQANGEHGVVLALCDVEYNDQDRTFQKWHTELKGGQSKFEQDRIKRTATSRYRKTRAVLSEILILRFDEASLADLGTMNQGRNSNGNSRKPKYLLNVEDAPAYEVARLTFSESL